MVAEEVGLLMWAVVAGRILEFALALFAAIRSVSAAILQWRSAALGEAKGRADSDEAHAEAARRAADRMQSIAEKPAGRDDIIRRLEEGSA